MKINKLNNSYSVSSKEKSFKNIYKEELEKQKNKQSSNQVLVKKDLNNHDISLLSSMMKQNIKNKEILSIDKERNSNKVNPNENISKYF